MRTIRLGVLAVALLAAGCGTPGGDSGDNTEKAEQSKKNSAKVDVAKAGDVTLTIWDQEVRGGQKKQITQLNKDVPGHVSERDDQARREVVRRPQYDPQARGLRAQGSRHRRGEPGAPGHGRARHGRAAQADGRLRRRLRLERPLVQDAARPQPLLLRRQAVRLRRPLRRLAAGRDRRRLLQQGQGRLRPQDVRRLRAEPGGREG